MSDIEKSSGNVYDDIGVENPQEMLVKAELALTIRNILKSKGLTQLEASKIIDLPQPKLSRLLNGQFRGISEAKMLECLIKLGRDVQIVIGEAKAQEGQLSVMVVA